MSGLDRRGTALKVDIGIGMLGVMSRAARSRPTRIHGHPDSRMMSRLADIAPADGAHGRCQIGPGHREEFGADGLQPDRPPVPDWDASRRGSAVARKAWLRSELPAGPPMGTPPASIDTIRTTAVPVTEERMARSTEKKARIGGPGARIREPHALTARTR
jgi:hypothetical protein